MHWNFFWMWGVCTFLFSGFFLLLSFIPYPYYHFVLCTLIRITVTHGSRIQWWFACTIVIATLYWCIRTSQCRFATNFLQGDSLSVLSWPWTPFPGGFQQSKKYVVNFSVAGVTTPDNYFSSLYLTHRRISTWTSGGRRSRQDSQHAFCELFPYPSFRYPVWENIPSVCNPPLPEVGCWFYYK